jgi:hypothetical protein
MIAEHHRGDSQMPVPRALDTREYAREHAEPIRSDENERQPKCSREVSDVSSGVDRDEQSSGAFDHDNLRILRKLAGSLHEGIEVGRLCVVLQTNGVRGEGQLSAEQARRVAQVWLAAGTREVGRISSDATDASLEGLERRNSFSAAPEKTCKCS